MSGIEWEEDNAQLAVPQAETSLEHTQNAPVVEKPARKRRKMLSEDHLLSKEGLRKIKSTFPSQFKSIPEGEESKALSRLVLMYKQWAFDLYPGLNFEDFMERTTVLGKKQNVQAYLNKLRLKEKKRYQNLRPQHPQYIDSDGNLLPAGDSFRLDINEMHEDPKDAWAAAKATVSTHQKPPTSHISKLSDNESEQEWVNESNEQESSNTLANSGSDLDDGEKEWVASTSPNHSSDNRQEIEDEQEWAETLEAGSNLPTPTP